MSLMPSKNKFDAFIRVTRTPFSKYDYIMESAPEQEEAVRLCKESASKQGWQPPVWWQWWRRKDSREPFSKRCSGL